MNAKLIITTGLIIIGGLAMNKAQNLKRVYKNEVQNGLSSSNNLSPDLITEDDLTGLPEPVQKYLRYAGVVGHEHVQNVKIVFKGRIRGNPDDPWMTFDSEQYNIFNEPLRAFYITAKKMGVPAGGLHLYKNESAYMKIKLLGLIKMVDVNGPKMDVSETVTFFNDACFFAPAQLVDMDIKWEQIDSLRVKATYVNGNQSISAILHFNQQGQLINFVSDDRYELNGNDQFIQRTWFTPIVEYKEMNGRMMPVKAGAWYKRPTGEYCYGEFTLVDVKYNCKEMD